jgi:hypothetical protein
MTLQKQLEHNLKSKINGYEEITKEDVKEITDMWTGVLDKHIDMVSRQGVRSIVRVHVEEHVRGILSREDVTYELTRHIARFSTKSSY